MRSEAGACATAGVALLTTSGVDPNIGDALCIGSATLFGVHKWRSETVTARFKDNTNELIAVQLLALAGAASLFCAPQMLELAAQGPGVDFAPSEESTKSERRHDGQGLVIVVDFQLAYDSVLGGRQIGT